MIYATRIDILYKEGDQRGLKLPMCFATWDAANHQLRSWAVHAPKGGGYDKTDFKITWSDGDTYEGRFDLQHEDMFRQSKFGLLGSHIYEFVAFYAGLHKPSHFTQDEYDSVVTRENPQDYLDFLHTHLLHDLDSRHDYWWEIDHNTYEVEREEIAIPCELCGLPVADGENGFFQHDDEGELRVMHYDCPGDSIYDNYEGDQ